MLFCSYTSGNVVDKCGWKNCCMLAQENLLLFLCEAGFHITFHMNFFFKQPIQFYYLTELGNHRCLTPNIKSVLKLVINLNCFNFSTKTVLTVILHINSLLNMRI